MEIPGILNGAIVLLFCQRDGSNTPSNVRHTRPSPSTPVLFSWIEMTVSDLRRCCRRGGNFDLLRRDVDEDCFPARRIGSGDDRGANMLCCVRDADSVVPVIDSVPWSTASLQVPRRHIVSPALIETMVVG